MIGGETEVYVPLEGCAVLPSSAASVSAGGSHRAAGEGSVVMVYVFGDYTDRPVLGGDAISHEIDRFPV